MQEPRVFNRLGSAVDVGNGITGSSGTEISSPTYQSCYFDKGMYCTASNYATLPLDSNFENKNGCSFVFYVKYTDYSVTNGNPSSGDRYLMSLHGAVWGNDGYFWFFHKGSSSLTRVVFSPSTGNQTYVDITTGMDIAVNDIVYYNLMYDSTITTSANRWVIYYYNITSGQTGSWNSGTVSGTLGQTKFKNTHYLKIGQAPTSSSNASAVIENTKAYNYAKSDNNDKFDPRGGMNDQQGII